MKCELCGKEVPQKTKKLKRYCGEGYDINSCAYKAQLIKNKENYKPSVKKIKSSNAYE